jgi:hypothetical protein
LGPGAAAYTSSDWSLSENFVFGREKYKKTAFPHFSFFSKIFGENLYYVSFVFAGQKQIFIHL